MYVYAVSYTYICMYIRICSNTILYKDINSKACLKDLLSIETTEGWFIIHCSCTKAPLYKDHLSAETTIICYRQVLLYTHCLYCTCRWNTVKTQCIVPHMHIKHPNGYVNEMYIHTYVHTYIRMYVCMYVCMYPCMYVCVQWNLYNPAPIGEWVPDFRLLDCRLLDYRDFCICFDLYCFHLDFRCVTLVRYIYIYIYI